MTCSNGSASGVIVPGTGVHLNNMLGEQDLNPLGFHRHPAGPPAAEHDGPDDRAARRRGRAGRRQRRLQPDPLGDPADDHPLDRRRAAGPGGRRGASGPLRGRHRLHRARASTRRRSERAGRELAPFRERNLFFGGAQAAARDAARGFSGGGDPRRGGAAIVVEADDARRRACPAPLWLRCWPARWRAAGSTCSRPTCSCSPAPGQGTKLTLLVNDGGTIRCNGGKAQADLRRAADPGSRSGRQPRAATRREAHDSRPPPGTVYYYRIRLQQGTISFPDRAAAHPTGARPGGAVRGPGAPSRPAG